MFTIVWTPLSAVIESLEVLRKQHPNLPIEVVGPYNFFALFTQHYASAAAASTKRGERSVR